MKKDFEAKLDELISPENRMSEAMRNSLNPSDENSHPIIEMRENEVMPIFLFISKLTFLGSPMNLMIAIQYHFADQTIEIRGRMRFEDAGRKTIFGKPEKVSYGAWNYEAMKHEIRDMHYGLTQVAPFRQAERPVELEFEVGESFDSILKKMNDSGQFDIGTIPKP